MGLDAHASTDAKRIRRAVWRVVLPYAVFACLWIVLSDRALSLLPGGDSAWLQTFKGWFFVLVTSGLLYGVVHDMLRRITEADRRRLEEQSDKLHALSLLDAIAEGSSDAIFAKDDRGRYLLFNRAASGYTGWSSDEVLGRDDTTVLGPEQATRIMENDRLVIDRGEVITFEESVHSIAGEFTFLATKGPLRGADGKVIGIFGISRDITAMKAAEYELRKLSLAVEQSPEAIVITDLDGRVEYVNSAFSAHSGYQQADMQGKSASALGREYTAPEVFDGLWDSLRAGQIWNGEFVNQRADGSTYVVSAKVVPIRQMDGRISNYLSIQEDITEKKRLAAELDQYRRDLEVLVASRTRELSAATARAEAANRAKSDFLANMSHEIRTPMNAVIGLIHLLREDRPAPHQVERLSRIDNAANHLLRIINNILDLSKVESGQLQLEDVAFKLSGVFEHVMSLVAEQARSKRIRLYADPALTDLQLRGDELRLRQALLNYVSNAVKFTDYGSVVIRAEVVEDRGNALLLRFEVRDTGVGVPADTLPRLFEAFEQVDASTSRRYGGSGLGLAITRSLAQLMGGEAGADSEPGRGSAFWFTALFGRGSQSPAVPTAKSRSAAIQLRARQGGTYVLLCDDDAVSRAVTLDVLAGAGIRVDAVGSGLEVVERCRHANYDLVLMDIHMADMNGFDATRVLREQVFDRHVPILALTAFVFEADKRACFAAGMDDFIAKPVDPDVLFATLLRWLPEAGDVCPGLVQPSAPALFDVAAADAGNAALVEMRSLLGAANMRASQLLETERPLFVSVLGTDYARFERHMRAFRYAEALALLLQHMPAGVVDEGTG
ncbi:PAS domain S-box protein [Azoarcus sp. L1K30]|uniref:PAS domain-containing hybrid sensor histidine kinase/response regulator n=1 Tax=Azoarcus sp. L1K30 TaxID=2820277 RepID=UPI001B82CD9B|nr:PAS domain-containing hybrid sensor histidine kinase/response regulator [Azoarcus sp. L1K30]MBR0566388.1 PAS domain S-box protein [Azoarcus sp. L1K30]